MAVKTKLNLISDKFCQTEGGLLTLSGNTSISCVGTLKYATNQCATYTARSVVDAGYVTGLTTTSGVQTANNGLTKSGTNVRLGGALTGNTTITGNYTLNLCSNAKLNTQCGYQISGVTMFRTSASELSSIYLGRQAGSNGTGTDNFAVGYGALSANTTGCNNIAQGYKALSVNSGNDNIALGYQALCLNSTGCNNIANGYQALKFNTIGCGNIAQGCQALYANTCGCNNIAQGNRALFTNNSCNNTAQGSGALYGNTTGSNNVAQGFCALYGNTTGSNNMAQGFCALYGNTTGSNNFAQGIQSLSFNVSGSDNTAIGQCSGYQSTGSNNVYLGRFAGSGNTSSNRLYIANNKSCTLIYGDFTGNTVTFPTVKICNTPATGTNTDSILVWNSSDKCVKLVSGGAVLTSAITGATNGLTKIGQNVKLGGALTGNTSVNMNLNTMYFTGTYSNVELKDKSPINSGYSLYYYKSASGATFTSSSLLQSYGEHCFSVCNSNSPFTSKAIDICWTGDMTVIDTVRSKGLIYAANYCSNFVPRSLVDKGYVTGQTTTSGVQTANNGLTKTGTNVRLGGTLTGATTINGGTYGLNLGASGSLLGAFTVCSASMEMSPSGAITMNAGTTVGICPAGTVTISPTSGDVNIGNTGSVTINPTVNASICPTGTLTLDGSTICVNNRANYDADYSGSYTIRSLVDKAYVTGQTTTSGVQTANNGLTKTGTNVRLGGALTGNTLISGAYTLSLCSGTLLNTQCGYQISGVTMFKTGGLRCNIYIGESAGNTTGSGANNFGVGYQALSVNGIGEDNIGMGNFALLCNTIGCNNVALGSCAMGYNVCGCDNIAQGWGTLRYNTCGCNNLAMGRAALYCGVWGCNNVALGSGTLRINRYGCNNVALGVEASAVNTCGCNNIAQGYQALPQTNIGCDNIGLGQLSLYGNSCGNDNIGIGTCTGYQSVVGSGNVYLGKYAGSGNTRSNQLYIANNKSCTLIYGDFTGNTVTLPTVKICNTPSTGTNSDALLVWNSSDKCIKTINGGAVLSAAITGATNGLTKVGQNVKLGGALTGNTLISGSNTLCITTPIIETDVQYLTFNSNPTTPTTNGSLYYKNNALNFNREISGVTLQIGEESVVRVKNTTGSPILNGSVVYICGSVAGIPSIAKSIASNLLSAERVLGLTTNTILDNNEGYVTTMGLIHDINTLSWTAGSPLYLSATQAGCLTGTPPTYPNETTLIGYVTLQNATTGSIFVIVEDATEYVRVGMFTGYTASTQTALNNRMLCSDFDVYTGNTTPIINSLVSMCSIAITGATNGLSKYGSHSVCLGGTISSATLVCGAQSLKFGDLCGITLSTQGTTDIGLNSKSNGGVYIKSQSGTVDSITDFTTAIGIVADYNATSGFAVYDNRAGSNQTGIVYAADYSSNYVSRSLVDKGYVDSVATGLEVLAAAMVTTTGSNIGLSGLTTIDSVALTTGMRVLVKDQTIGWKNGIYSASTGVWGRASDFNFNPSVEVANGDLIPVLSGVTHANSIWVLTTPNPIVSGVTSLVFAQFLQQFGVTEGNGIDVTTIGINKQISVELGSSACGLQFAGTGLALDWNTYRVGMCCTSGGHVDLRVSKCSPSGVVIPVAIATGGTNVLYVDSSTISTCIGTPMVTACNGLTKVGNAVILGGTLSGCTTINGGSYDFTLCCFKGYSLGFCGSGIITDTNAIPKGLQYAGNYCATYCDRSLVDKQYVDNRVISGVLACNGLTKVGSTVILGGTLTGNTLVSYGANRLCFTDGGVSCMDIISDCSKIHVENTSLYLRSCTNTTCLATVCITNTGIISLSTNAASCGIVVTAPSTGALYAADYCAGFKPRSLVDKGYVTGQTTTSGVQTANNGLTKTGTNVRLGGALTGNTSITGAYTLSLCSGALLNTQCGYQISGQTVLRTTNAGNPIMYIGQCVGNVGIGYKALTGNTSGTDNIAMGTCALNRNGIGFNNVAVGAYSLQLNTSGQANTAIGVSALFGNTTGNENIGVGDATLACNKTGCCNIALGVCASFTNNSGSNNIAIGTYASFTNNCGSDNIVFGNQAGYLNSTGSLNMYFGRCAGYNNLTSGKLYIATGVTSNLIYGDFALNTVTLPTVKICNTPATGTNTDSILVWNSSDKCVKLVSGGAVLTSAITGATNGLTKIGQNVKLGGALTGDTSISGAYTLSITGGTKLNTKYGLQISGSTILKASSINISSIYIGQCAGSNGNGNHNFGVGFQSLCKNTSGGYNVSLGMYSMYTNANGSYNIAQGQYALYSNISGCNNIAQGCAALCANVTGCRNVGLGECALYTNSTGNNNIALGFESLYSNTASNNIAQGYQALGSNTTGSDNIGIGQCTGYQSIVGSGNVYLGSFAGSGNTASNKLYIANNKSSTLIYGDFTGNTVTLPTVKICNTPATGVCSDGILVWNSSDKCVKQISAATLVGSSVICANNGLTKSGQNVRLGGTLTGATTVNDGGFAMCFNGTGSFNVCSCTLSKVAGSTAGAYTQICSTNAQIRMLQCNISTTTCSAIILNNSEVCVTPKTNAITFAGSCVLGCVGTTAYGKHGLDASSATLLACSTCGCSSFISCGTDGMAHTYGACGVVINTPSVNGLCLVGAVKVVTTPSTGTISDSVLVWNSSDKCIKTVAGSALGDKNNIYSRTVVTTSTGLTTNAAYVILVNHTVPVTITLPTTPIDGEAFKIKDASIGGALTNNITISRNGKSIDRALSDALINTDGGAIELVYDDSLSSWFSLAFIN